MLQGMWSKKDPRSIAYKNHLAKTNPGAQNALKIRAAKVTP